MNKFYKFCTSLEQSKILLELGIDVYTADMHYYKNSFGDYIEGLYNSNDLKEGCELKGIEYIPAWSLSALLKLMPNFNMFKRTIECRIETTDHLVDKACDPIDAAFEMVVWLKENEKI